MRRLILSLAVVVASLGVWGPSSANAAFGFESLGVTFVNADGSPMTQAGSHPFAFRTSLAFNTVEEGGLTLADEELKDLTVEEMAGFVGKPTATPRCSSREFLNRVTATVDFLPTCGNDTVVGFAALSLEHPSTEQQTFYHAPVYNLTPPPGVAAELGFYALDERVTVDLRVSEKPPYNVIAKVSNVPQVVQLLRSSLTIWGDPADPAHDSVRGSCMVTAFYSDNEEPVSQGTCPSEAEPEAFVTTPRSCTGGQPVLFSADSWQNPSRVISGSAEVPQATGCSLLGFSPEIEAQTTSSAGESPTGLSFSLDIDDPGLTNPAGRAQSDIERTVVTLPEGFTTNSAAAGGLVGCTEAQLDRETSASEPGEGCPEASKIGSVEVETPLLEEALTGSLYVAQPFENEFHSLIALYIVIRNAKLGIAVHQGIEVRPDPVTGRLTAVTDQLPQLPFSHFRLNFREGPRAPLTTPAKCGTYPVSAQLYPYANSDAPISRTATLQVDHGPEGRSCGAAVGGPDFNAGTITPLAGSYSPFVFNLARVDGSPQLRAISASLPSGLIARIAGVPYCPEAAIASAAARFEAGQGAGELSRPSCPAASAVGTVSVGAGAGSQPYYVTGQAYLAGPYKGAPLSLEIITPAIAGPFDLGVVAIRTALYVDAETAKITAVSDPIPTILHGLPLDVRSISLAMKRPEFTLNPTSCEPMSVSGTATGTMGEILPLSSRFQVGGCAGLGFKPSLAVSLKGPTKRTGHPALKAVVTYPKKGAYANIARAQVNLPHSEFIDQNNLDKTCTKPVLLAGNCPKRSVYGHAKAWTPLLEKPLAGPVYLVGGYGYKLPALVAELNGQIRVVLKGKVDTGPNGGIRGTFEAVPDAPVSRFVLEMKGGKNYGLLVNSENICRSSQKANARFVAQNGDVEHFRPKIADSCVAKGRRRSK